MKRALALLMPMLAGCATTVENLATAAPYRIYESARSRAAVTDCLLDRLSGPEAKPQRNVGQTETVLSFAGLGWAMHPALYHFTIRDRGAGSAIEVRVQRGLARQDLTSAETCL